MINRLLAHLPYGHVLLIMTMGSALVSHEHVCVCVLPAVYTLMVTVTYTMHVLGRGETHPM